MQLTGQLSYLLYAASIVAAAPIEKRAGTTYSGGLTATDVDDGVCAPITLIFARGSTEPGTMGSSVGPALAKALISSQGASGVAIQGVDYTATIESNIDQGRAGGPVMAALAQKALKNCPNTKIALSGYSQGAMVVHVAASSLGSDISSAVLYGDPELHTASSVGSLPASRVKEFCASGDGVCETGGFAITAAHLSYTTSSDIPDGASFIVQNAGSPSSSGTTNASSTASGSGSSSTDASSSSTGSTSGGLGSLGGLSGLGSGSSSSGLGSLSSLGGGSGSSGLGSLSSLGGGSGSSGLGSLSSLGGGSGSSGLGSLSSLGGGSGSSGLGSLSSLGGGSGSSGLGSLSSLGGGSGSSGLGSLSSLGGGSGSSSGLGSLSGLGGTGTSSGLGSLTSGTSGLGSLGSSGLGSLTGGSSGLGGFKRTA
ncbi:hypothetical protein LTR91_011582 [Friedmanniomyces endolithicus]|uniref:cutinase n=2 Tax=Friedmanniomyces endolithicus TaxID=329885 RepID=A0AAN6FJG5_9PEZI|nr:hypothetical protein LTR01_002209 [Friedmanniomyces endolithicus]KAK0318608.1 hypothetical protein LTR82_010350 [Friedmanniomyces endolithicus]KAK0831526.1 hypothetical protein LTR73_002909 [Friedmanniomyces endolithicus]KAK0915921.1 hypothetical protein LTR57_013240 [Friedmanniomyces endolithicus]KAK0963148.1 hypothetical protein LTS01_019472 [Friedmanniomyces endolithicus]